MTLHNNIIIILFLVCYFYTTTTNYMHYTIMHLHTIHNYYFNQYLPAAITRCLPPHNQMPTST